MNVNNTACRSGFSLIEVLIVIGILAILAGIGMPLFRSYLVRNDLDRVKEQAVQGLGRAKLLAQSARGDSAWGFFVPAGILYKGISYSTRDPSFDELYPMPSTITISGSLLEVSYSKFEGKPSGTGTIILSGLENEKRTITVTVAVSEENVATNVGNTLFICHNPGGTDQQQLSVMENEWATHQAENDPYNDNEGTCPAGSGSSVPSTESSSSISGQITICHKPGTHLQQTMTVPSTAWPAHQQHGDTMGVCNLNSPGGSICPSIFALEDDGTIIPTRDMSMHANVLASEITFGAGGPPIPVYVRSQIDDGTWKKMFGGTAITAGRTDTVSNITAGSAFAMRLQGEYRQSGWLAFQSQTETNDGSDHTLLLRAGDSLPSYIPYAEQQSLRAILASYLDANGTLTIEPCSLVLLTELSAITYPPSLSQDFQDAVLLLQFTGS